jgi:hypothetical protein
MFFSIYLRVSMLPYHPGPALDTAQLEHLLEIVFAAIISLRSKLAL